MAHYRFQSLKANVSETYGSMTQLLEKFDWSFFSEDACNQIEAYEVLDEAFRFSDDSKALVRNVAERIAELKEKAKDGDGYTDREVVMHLVKYIRSNFPDDLWDEYTEFNLPHLHRGY